ncbi:serine hydrolase [Patescibacteria group bacterium]|nr:serine hydrolase [Patescibacteria group bacterium]
MRIKLLVITILAALGFVAAFPCLAANVPEKRATFAEYPVQNLTTRAAIVMDKDSGEVLFSHNHDFPWIAASLTKMMTGVVFIEQGLDLNAQARLASADEVGGGRLRVEAGALMTLKDIFFSALTGSANNCAMALMSLSGLTNERFVELMNFRAWVLGMKDTKYYEPSGMDTRNTTTVDDTAILARYAFKNSIISKAATTFWYRFNVLSPQMDKSVKNTNDLLLYDPDLYITGGKTGYLPESGYNLVIQTKHMRETRPELIVVILGSDTRQASFNEAKSLALWMWQNYEW